MPTAGQVRRVRERTPPLCAARCLRSDSEREFIPVYSLRCSRRAVPLPHPLHRHCCCQVSPTGAGLRTRRCLWVPCYSQRPGQIVLLFEPL